MNSYKEDIQSISQEKLPWGKLSGTNILVTGATGLIGACLVEALMMVPWRDFHVFACGRNEERARQIFKDYANDKAFHFLKHDVMEPLENDVSFDYIIHAASNGSPNFFVQKPVEVMKANIDGVINLMEYGLSHGMKRMLYISSGEVYGEGDGRVFTEDFSGYVDCVKPRSCYPSSKRAAETLCASYISEYGADVVIARPCHVYGPLFTEYDNRVYAQFIRNVLSGEDIVMKSTGEQFRSWCYVVDCISALLYILLKGDCGNAYNIADDGSNISIRDLAQMIAEIGHRRVVIDMPSPVEVEGLNPVKQSIFSSHKLHKLGWAISGTMKEKMKHTINQCKQTIL